MISVNGPQPLGLRSGPISEIAKRTKKTTAECVNILLVGFRGDSLSFRVGESPETADVLSDCRMPDNPPVPVAVSSGDFCVYPHFDVSDSAV